MSSALKSLANEGYSIERIVFEYDLAREKGRASIPIGIGETKWLEFIEKAEIETPILQIYARKGKNSYVFEYDRGVDDHDKPSWGLIQITVNGVSIGHTDYSGVEIDGKYVKLEIPIIKSSTFRK